MSWSICAALFVASLICKQRSGTIAGFLYCLVSFAHWQAYKDYPADSVMFSSYYVIAASLDAMIASVIIVSDDFWTNKKILVPLCITMILSIVNNLFGLYLWQSELEPAAYNNIGTAIYLLFALLLIWNRVNAQLARIFSFISGNTRPHMGFNSSSDKKVRKEASS